MRQPIHTTIKPVVKAPKRFELTWAMIEELRRQAIIASKNYYETLIEDHDALEIILQCQTFSPGVFERDENGRWRRAGENPKHANMEGC